MAGLANLHGGLDDSERRRRDDARSAYVRELDEQVRPVPDLRHWQRVDEWARNFHRQKISTLY
eukprot:scaffold72793_cov37-Prasinocladus_malaysianus.AAC.1